VCRPCLSVSANTSRLSSRFFHSTPKLHTEACTRLFFQVFLDLHDILSVDTERKVRSFPALVCLFFWGH
jgi:hypothetical protein